jgi:hypothetical protein
VRWGFDNCRKEESEEQPPINADKRHDPNKTADKSDLRQSASISGLTSVFHRLGGYNDPTSLTSHNEGESVH